MYNINKKTILSILTTDSFYGGAERNVSYVLDGYHQLGHKVLVIIWHQSSIRTHQWQSQYNFEYIEIHKKGLLGMVQLIKCLYNLKNRKIDLTYISNITLASLVGFALKLRLFRTDKFIVRDPSSPFLRYKSTIKLWTYKLRYKLGYSKVDYLIFQTDTIKDAFIKHTGIRLPHEVLGNPIDLNVVIGNSKIDIANLPELYIVTCGRLIDEKGFDLLIEAFASSEYRNSHELLILGNGPLKESLLSLIKELKLEKCVKLLGFVENPMPYFKNAKLCVIPSRAEGFPNVLYQMLALNDNVLMTKCCGSLENIPVVTFIEPFSIKALTNGIDYKLNNPSNYGANIKEKFLENKTIITYINKFIEIENGIKKN